MTAVHQALSAAGPYDAVTNQALLWRDLLAEQGLDGGLYAHYVDPRVSGVFKPLDQLRPAAGDAVALHYSAYAPGLRRVLELPGRLLLSYHNVTPPGYLWRHQTRVAVQCAVGRAHLVDYARAADVPTAVSAFNAAELAAAGAREPRVVPIILDPGRLGDRGSAPVATGEGPLVLCVGRLVPNKRHDLVFEAFAAFQRAHAPEARLLCVGEPLSPAYRELLEGLARESGARGVTLAGGLSQPDLNAAFAAADVLLSASEHEGFCVPLLEAFHFGVPVVARAAGGMPEVGGDAVLWTGTGFDPAVAAELMALAVADGELRGELGRRGGERLAEYAPEHTREKIRAAVEEAVS